jgi:hypothetical protein
MTDKTPGIPELNRRMLFRGGLAAGAGLAVAGLGTVGLTRVAEAVTFDTQFYWAYCANCASLWYTHNNTAGVCTYALLYGGGTGHVKSPSFSYELRYNVSGTGGPSYQPGWNWCGKCQCLFYADNKADNWCPWDFFNGPHTTGGFPYSVLYNDAVAGSSQGNWWWCGQCQGLFNAAGGIGGWCPNVQTDSGPHVAGQGSTKSLAYDVSYYSTSSP